MTDGVKGTAAPAARRPLHEIERSTRLSDPAMVAKRFRART